MTERVLGADISFYQDDATTTAKPELGQMKQAGLNFVIIRHSQNGTLDRMFEYYMGDAILHEIPRMIYGFLQYWLGSNDPAAQGKFIANWFTGKSKARGWCDYEQPSSAYPALPPREQALDQIHRWMDQVDAGMGIESGLYTNLSTIKYLSPIPSWLINRPFWLAWPPYVPAGMDVVQYTRNMIPASALPFTNLKIWQFSWAGPGIQAGMESRGLDIDWFLGSISELYNFCGMTLPPSPDDNRSIALDSVSKLEINLQEMIASAETLKETIKKI